MYQHLIKIALLFLILTSSTSCSDSWLDQEPSNGESSSTILSTYAGLQSALIGIYDGLQGSRSQNTYYTAQMFYYGDVRGDDMQARVPGGRSSLSYEMNYNADNAPQIWTIPYDIVHRANKIISAVDKKQIIDGTDEQIGDVYAQALCCRSLAYFDLVRIYGMPYTYDEGASMGVPLVLEPISSLVSTGRSSVSDVYNQVVNDLNKSIDSGYLSTSRTLGYFNLWAAKALLARIYLYMGKNKEALSICEDIINNSPYVLWSEDEYVSAWSKQDTPEMIFEIINYDMGDYPGNEGIAYDLREDGYADCIVTQTFSDLMNEDENDVRQGLLLPSTTATFIKLYGTDKVFINKFPGRSGAGDVRINNLPVLRLSEVYLNASESAIKLYDTTGALENKILAVKYLKPIVSRANSSKESTINENTISLDRILKERRKELFGEGHRFFDAMRNNETITRYADETNKGRHYSLVSQSQAYNREYYRAILPIPASEIEVNSLLKEQQNKGY